MSVKYVAVQWNARKRAFDYFVLGAVVLYLAAFIGTSIATLGADAPSEEILLLRAAGSASFVLLNIILMIGPLARIDRRFAPLLYNRRHLGVTMFILALVHAVVVMITYFGFAERDPLFNVLSLQGADVGGDFGFFPVLGLVALTILFFMAATSHDFWQKVLGPLAWKSLHMMVYVAYALLVGHIVFGALRSETTSLMVLPSVVFGGFVLTGLHLYAAVISRRGDRLPSMTREDDETWVDGGPVEALAVDAVKGVRLPSGERVALIHHAEGFSAVHGVCAHQAGPLYEGKVIDGCLTCPWHGWQYRPQDGKSPPPFEETLPIYRVRIKNGRLQVLDQPLAAGTALPPAREETKS